MNFNTHQETDKSNKVLHFRPDCRHNNKVGSEPNNNSGEKVEVQKNNVSQGNHYVTMRLPQTHQSTFLKLNISPRRLSRVPEQ